MPGDGGHFSGGWALTITTVVSGFATAPTLDDIPNQMLAVNTPTAVLPFTINGANPLTASLAVNGHSSNVSLVPAANVVFGGSGSSRTVRVTPAPNQTGKSTITVTVSDGILTAADTFVVTVDPVNTASLKIPTITSAGSASATVGVGFRYAIAATNEATRFDAINIPPGLAVDTTTGAITGTPTTSGTFDVRLIAANANGADVATLTLQIIPAASATNQMMTILPLSGVPVVGQPLTLHTTTSSGLPVILSVVSGNAVVIGNTLTLYDSGSVTVRGTQGGSRDFNPASAELTIASASSAAGSLIYMGTIGSDPLAATFDLQHHSGTLYSMISSAGEAFVVPLDINSDGTFRAIVQGFSVRTRLPGPERTFQGRILYGTLDGTIAELGRTLTATLQPSTGPTKSLTGVYTANTILSASGKTCVVAGAHGQAYVLSLNPTLATAGTGTVSPDGTFEFRTLQAVTFEGVVNSTAKTLSGTMQFPNQTSTAELLGVENNIPRTTRLINISIRGRLSDEGGGTRALISGIVVGGTGQQPMLLRAIGPTLAHFGVQDAVRNPRLQLYDNVGRIIAQNDDWGNLAGITALGNRIGAFGLEFGSLDSALVATVDPGVYTLQVGSGNTGGVALVEIYDAGEDLQTTSLVNLSTRGNINPGESEIVGGFVVSGNAPIRVLIRGIGPTLQTFGVAGVVADPALRIFQGSVMIAQNDNWEVPRPVGPSQTAASGAEIAAASHQVGAFSMNPGSMDAAIIITLAPGAYTAEVSGTNNTTGSGLLEIYQVPLD
jgi:hypothetical protein